ncbi:MAG: addiction module protein [Pirellulales bacterium]
MSPETSSIFSLSLAEKLELVEDLWDDISRNPEEVPVYDWQIKTMELRKRELANAPESALSWDELTGGLRRLRGDG